MGIRSIFILLMITVASPWGFSQSPHGIVINEVFTGSPDWIEIRNFSGATQDISGWQIEASFAYTNYPTFTFPPGTQIAPGQAIVVVENSNPTPFGINPPPIGTLIFNTHFGYGWIGTSSGAVVLVDNNYQLEDWVAFGTTGFLVPPGAANSTFLNPVDRLANNPSTGNALFRTRASDHDDGSDWGQSSDGAATPGMPNPGQSTGPQPIASLVLSPNTGIVSTDPNTNAVQIGANITGIILDDGREISDPNWDVIIGGNITLTATAVTPTTSDFSNLIWTQSLGKITALNGEFLSLNGIVAAESNKEFTLAGPLGTEPRGQRSMSTRSLATTSISGPTSAALNQLQLALQFTRIHFVVRFEMGGARLTGIALKNLSAAPLSSAMANSGSGSLQVGVVGATQSEIYNVFVINPSHATGAGPVYGITWGNFQWQQVLTPLGTMPYHVTPSGDGTYFFESPPGIIPPGIWLDFVAIEVVNQVPVFSEPCRVFF